MTNTPPQTDSALGYVYFVAFVYTTEDEPSKERTENDSVVSRTQITTSEDIDKIQAYMLNLEANKQKGWRTLKIINYQFLECAIATFSPVKPTA